MPMLLVGRAADLSVPYSESEVLSLRSLLEPRSPRGGGGGGGRGGGGSVSSGGGKSSGSSSGSSSSGSSSGASGGGVRSSTPGFTAGSISSGGALRGSSSASGVRTPYSITSGAFVGRTAGGGTRSNVYSGGGYGSGYSGTRSGRAGSTAGLGFPFIYMPLGFGALGYGYYGSQEYRRGDRPGGDETTWLLQPPAGVNADGNTFFLLGDTNSVNDVKNGLAAACGTGTGNATAPAGFLPLPNTVVQYYRASSFALGLVGYNNGQPLNGTDDAALEVPFTALPSSVNQTYFNCLNSTVGTQVPLVDGSADGALSALGGINPLLMAPALLVAIFLGAA